MSFKIFKRRSKVAEFEIEDLSCKFYADKDGQLSIQVFRNLEGIRLEKEGQIDMAIELYEANIRENFEGSHPYDRLAIIYRKRKQIDDEIRVLEKAIWVYENVASKARSDRLPKLERFIHSLERARKLKKE